GVRRAAAERCDMVIAFGGGSVIDAGKAMAAMMNNTGALMDYLEVVGGGAPLENPPAPCIAIPTTAGTGTEVTKNSVIGAKAHKVKVSLRHDAMVPDLAVVDPELTHSMPPSVTAATGMDALAHCLEAYCAPGFHPMAEGIAVEGLRLVKEWLPTAVEDGGNLAARAHMLAAAAMGATAFQKGLGAIHSLSHPIGALYDTHHGLTNAVVMPYVLAFNRPAIEARMGRLAAWLGLPQPSFAAVQSWILGLRRALSIPHSLREIGVGDDRIEEIVKMAAADPTAPTNPVPLDPPSLRAMMESALEGRVA
ncbi:MAG: iron-containing alcohol dehydrogenase, partial [Kiloniellales bacterium]|nr:iron-containing alcohol dehydrogenase [Kiloniellales bacterium]